MKLDMQLIKDLYDTLAFDEAPSGDDKTDAEVYRKHHNKLIQSLYLLEHIAARLAILEAAIAWHGWDEVPDESSRYFEIKYLDGSLGAGTLVICDSDVFVKMLRHGNIKLENAHEFATGWRYPVGDLGEETTNEN